MMELSDVTDLSKLSTDELRKLELNLRGYDEEPVDIETFIFDKYYLGNYFHGTKFSPHWLDFLNRIYEKKIEAPAFLIFERGCLEGDTLIPLLDGKVLSIKDTAIEFKNGNHNMKVMSYNLEKKCCESDIIANAFSTGIKPVYRIHLSNGKHIDCTSNHRFLGENHIWLSIDSGLDINSRLISTEDGIVSVDTIVYIGDREVFDLTTRNHNFPLSACIYSHNSIGRGKCLESSTFLEDSTGKLQTIKEIFNRFHRSKDPIYLNSYNFNTNKFEYDKVIDVINNGYRVAYKIHLSNGKSVVCTRDHRFLSTENEWITINRGISKGVSLKTPSSKFVIVTKIERWGHGEMYDITTENNHNFVISSDVVSHNSTTACVGALYDQYMMMCLKSPQEYFGLVPSEQIVLFIMNVTLGLSEHVLMGKINSMISQSPFFSEKSRIAKENQEIKTRFPKGIDIRSGSRVSHTLGQAIHCLSEDTIIPIHRGVEFTPLFISIKDIYDRVKNNIDTFVYSYSINSHERLVQPVINAFDNDTEDVYKIELSNHKNIECTINHRLLTSNLKYKHLYELRIGDKLKSGYENNEIGVEIIDITPVGKKHVYDIEIQGTHNFLLESDVYSHNSAILSEAAFSIYNNQFMEAFNSILARQQSRFMKEGKASGRIWVDSSEKDTGSILNELCDKYKGQKGVIIDSGPLWEIRPWNYGTEAEKNICKFFYVYKGSDRESASLINMNDQIQIERLCNDEPGSILVVPESHRSAFEADIDRSLRDLGGIATASQYRLFRNMKMLLNALVGMPLYEDIIELDFYDQNDQIIDHCKLPQYFDNLPNPNAARYIHVDIGISGDKLGFAMSYISGKKDVEVLKDITNVNGEKTVDSAITTVVELAFAIKNKAGQQVPLNKIRIFIKWLIDKGVVIGGVSSDSFQSASLLQEMKLLGIESTVISVDRTVDPYINLRNSIYEGRCILPANRLLRRELENLLIAPDGSKVDHPDVFPGSTERGSKDTADATCGVVFNCFKNQDKFNIFDILSSSKVNEMILQDDPVFNQFVDTREVKNENVLINDIMNQWSDIRQVNELDNSDPYLEYLKSLKDLNSL